MRSRDSRPPSSLNTTTQSSAVDAAGKMPRTPSARVSFSFSILTSMARASARSLRASSPLTGSSSSAGYRPSISQARKKKLQSM